MEDKRSRKQESVFMCPECGLHYRTKALREQCEAWCKEHKSCNIEITKHAVPDESTPP